MLLIVLFLADDASRFLSSNIEFHIFGVEQLGIFLVPSGGISVTANYATVLECKFIRVPNKGLYNVSIFGPKSLLSLVSKVFLGWT